MRVADMCFACPSITVCWLRVVLFAMTSVINVGGQRVGVQVIPQPQAASGSAQVGGFLRAASASAPVCIVSKDTTWWIIFGS